MGGAGVGLQDPTGISGNQELPCASRAVTDTREGTQCRELGCAPGAELLLECCDRAVLSPSRSPNPQKELGVPEGGRSLSHL